MARLERFIRILAIFDILSDILSMVSYYQNRHVGYNLVLLLALCSIYIVYMVINAFCMSAYIKTIFLNHHEEGYGCILTFFGCLVNPDDIIRKVKKYDLNTTGLAPGWGRSDSRITSALSNIRTTNSPLQEDIESMGAHFGKSNYKWLYFFIFVSELIQDGGSLTTNLLGITVLKYSSMEVTGFWTNFGKIANIVSIAISIFSLAARGFHTWSLFILDYFTSIPFCYEYEPKKGLLEELDIGNILNLCLVGINISIIVAISLLITNGTLNLDPNSGTKINAAVLLLLVGNGLSRLFHVSVLIVGWKEASIIKDMESMTGYLIIIYILCSSFILPTPLPIFITEILLFYVPFTYILSIYAAETKFIFVLYVFDLVIVCYAFIVIVAETCLSKYNPLINDRNDSSESSTFETAADHHQSSTIESNPVTKPQTRSKVILVQLFDGFFRGMMLVIILMKFTPNIYIYTSGDLLLYGIMLGAVGLLRLLMGGHILAKYYNSSGFSFGKLAPFPVIFTIFFGPAVMPLSLGFRLNSRYINKVLAIDSFIVVSLCLACLNKLYENSNESDSNFMKYIRMFVFGINVLFSTLSVGGEIFNWYYFTTSTTCCTMKRTSSTTSSRSIVVRYPPDHHDVVITHNNDRQVYQRGG